MSSPPWHSRAVFVYGTLKREQPNSFILQTAINKSKAKFLGQATTADCWPLIVYSPFNIPFLLDCKGTGKRVVGELYKVDLETLQTMDELEEHPTYYTRDTMSVHLSSTSPSDLVECETYFMRNFRRELLTTESLLTEYCDKPERRYVPGKDRSVGVVIDIKQPRVS